MKLVFNNVNNNIAKKSIKVIKITSKSATNQPKINIFNQKTCFKKSKILTILQQKYPKTFNKINILKIGILDDLVKQQIGVSKTALKKFLGKYCKSKKYRKLHVVNAKRLDLEGNVVGVVNQIECEGVLNEKNKKLANSKMQFTKISSH